MAKRRLHVFILLACHAACASAGAVNWHAVTDIATGGGVQGPWKQNDSLYDYVDDPAVAIDGSGRLAVAWVEQARKDVFFQRFAADGRTRIGKPVNVSRSPATFSWLPRVVIAPDNPRHVFLLWQEIIFSGASHGGEMFFARSEDGGASFSEPVNVSNSRGGDGKGRINRGVWHNGSYDLAAAPGGVLYAAWTEYDGPLWFSRSTDGGKRFSRPQRVAGGDKPVRAPSLAAGKGRQLYLAWTHGDDESADIHLALSSNGGDSFGEPVRLFPGKGYSDAPKVALDSTGTVHLAYAESAGGPFSRYSVRYARSTDKGRSFEAARELSPGAGFPSLAIEGGDVFLIWEMYPDTASRPKGLGMAVSRDGGASFSAPRAIPGSVASDGGSNGSRQGLLMKKLAASGNGKVAVVNSSMKENTGSRVWLMSGELDR